MSTATIEKPDDKTEEKKAPVWVNRWLCAKGYVDFRDHGLPRKYAGDEFIGPEEFPTKEKAKAFAKWKQAVWNAGQMAAAIKYLGSLPKDMA